VKFILLGFKQDIEFRVFAFEGIASDQTRTAHTIRADLALTQKHGIRAQELPLLCRGLLERGGPGDTSAMTFTEEQMCLHESGCVKAREAAILKRKPPRRHAPSPSEASTGWRSSQARSVSSQPEQVFKGA
jgi:hypothetical protein